MSAAPPQAAAYDSLIGQLEECALDPTLEQCCRRDVQEQIKVARLKQSLKSVDRSDAHLRLQHGVLGAPGAGASALQQGVQVQQQQQNPETSDLDSDFGSEDDAELEQLRQQRMQQLQQQAAQAKQLQQEGYGKLNDVVPSGLQSLLEEAARCVVHIAAEGWPACDALDELLTSLAYRYTATHFSRCALPKATPTHQQQQGAVVGGLHLPHGVPALLVAKGGRLVGSAPVVRFGGANDIIEDEVVGYLQRLRVLKAPGDTRGTSSSSRGAAGVAAAAAGAAGLRGICSSSDEEQEEEEAEEQGPGQRGAPCELCGRTYPHEHVRAAYARRDAGSDSDE